MLTEEPEYEWCDLLPEIRSAKEEIRKAEKLNCKCSGFTLQYEGSCQCEKGKRLKVAQANLASLIEKI